MDVAYWSPTSRADDLDVVGAELDDVVATSDVLQVCIALTPTTHHLLDRRRLGLMPPGSLLVNTARGAVVDHAALVAALAAGHLGGYATDVWDPEPPPPGDLAPVAGRLLITPHVAAITDTTYRTICVRAAEAALAALDLPD